MKVFIANFEGHYPTGANILATALTHEDAVQQINRTLINEGFKPVNAKDVIEYPLNNAYTVILLTGDY